MKSFFPVKEIYPTYFGVASPDRYQVLALMKYMDLQRWLHFSVVYENSVSGQRYFEQLKANVVDYEMCIVSSRLVDDRTNFTGLLESLMTKDKVYTVVFLGNSPTLLRRITDATEQLGAHGKVLWINAGHWYSLSSPETTIPGSLVVSFIHQNDDGLSYHLKSINPKTTKNPWFLKSFEDIFECPDDSCIYAKQRETNLYRMSEGAYVQDSVYAYALALNNMKKEHCINQKHEEAVRCLQTNSELYIKYLRSITFTGRTGAISFKAKFIKSEYVVIFQNLVRVKDRAKYLKPLAVYDSENKLTTVLNNVSWEHFTFQKEHLDTNIQCRPTCGPHHFKLLDHGCCWTCHKCQDNEIISKTGTLCNACPPLFWPLDNNTKVTECAPIIPETFDWLSATPVTFNACAALGIVIVFSVMNFYRSHQGNILIRSSSLHLSVIQLLSIACGYVAIPLLINHNSPICCNVGLYLFDLSVYALYATMLIKALKLYQIFNYSKTEEELKKLPRSIELVAFWLFFLTVVVTLLFLHVNFPLGTSVSQPDPFVEYAEIACSVPQLYVLSLLAMPICLLLISFIVSFLTISIPNTFRETRFVNMCALILLVMWIAFMPSYFTAVRPQMKMYFIALMVLLNHGIAIFFLFLPRIATIVYLGGAVRNASGNSENMESYFIQVPHESKRMSIIQDRMLNFTTIVQDIPVFQEPVCDTASQTPSPHRNMDDKLTKCGAQNGDERVSTPL